MKNEMSACEWRDEATDNAPSLLVQHSPPPPPPPPTHSCLTYTVSVWHVLYKIIIYIILIYKYCVFEQIG